MLSLDKDYFRALRIRADDPRRAKLIENIRANLQDICRVAAHSGAKVILSTVAVNLADCPPLGSLHRANLTATDQRRWEAAVAEGMRLEAAGQYPQAMGRHQEAVQHLRVVVDTFPDRTQFRVSLANELMALKDRDGALAQLKMAERSDADDRQVQEALAALVPPPGK